MSIKAWATVTAILWVVMVAGWTLDSAALLWAATAGFAVLAVERVANWQRSRRVAKGGR